MKFFFPVSALIFASSVAFANTGGNTDDKGNYVGTSPSDSNVTIDDTVSGYVRGGEATNSSDFDVTNNSVTVVDGGNVCKDVCGGFYGGEYSDHAVRGNSVAVAGGSIRGMVFGGQLGQASSGSVVSNSVTISNGTIDSMVFGGSIQSAGDASGNSVTISGGTITGLTVTGGIEGAVCGGIVRDNGDATGNSVTITGGTIGNGTKNGNVYGGWFYTLNGGNASANHVTISGGTVNGCVYGGYAHIDGGSDNGGSFASTGAAMDNSVTISGGQIGSDTVNCDVYGGWSDKGTVSGNSVTIRGGKMDDVYGGASKEGASSNNTVTISGGTVTGSVYGGYSDKGTATSNTVVISGSPTISGGVYGGISISSNGSAGNTLDVRVSSLTLKNVGNFETYKFYLPGTVGNGDTILLLTGDATKTDISKSTIEVSMEPVSGSASPLRVGDRITLIKNSAGVESADANLGAGFSVRQGVGLVGNFRLGTDDTSLYATLDSVRLNPQTKVFAEGWLGGAILAVQGADLVAGTGMTEAVKAGATANSGVHAFAAVSGGSLRYDTGSHVDMKSFSLMAGASDGWDGKHGHVTIGGFVEYGNGSYDTYNSFSDAASADGDGSSWYTGVGLLSRMDFAKSGALKNYLEASARLGRLSNDYGSDDLRDASGQTADYDATTTYASFHIGAGTVFTLSESVVFDFYGKYFYTWLEAERTTLPTGERMKFDDVESSRLRVGTRVRYDMNDHVKFYAGAAWEYEFDGDVDATISGYDIDAPTTQGNTGIGEIGVVFKPVETLPLTIDLGIQGYVGKREGATGSLNANFKYEF